MLGSLDPRQVLTNRIGDSLFDIIVRYPDSMPALEDLKVSQPHRVAHTQECLFKVDQRAKLVDSLLEAYVYTRERTLTSVMLDGCFIRDPTRKTL
jgi:hypothetical protein